jgi:hypothetical protein
MPVGTLGKKPGIIIIPLKQYTPVKQVIINGVDVSEDAISSRVDLGVTTATSAVNIILDNNDGKYTKEFAIGNIIKCYADFTSGTTKIFEGRLYTPTYNLDLARGHIFNILGKCYGADTLNIIVTKQYTTDTAISTIFIELLDEYMRVAPFNHSSDNSNIATISTTAKPTWNGVSLWKCFQDLVLATQDTYHFYCDFDKIWHLFEKGTRIDSTEAIIYGDNLVGLGVTDGDLNNLFNKEIVYGQEIETIPIMKVKEDTSNQTLYGVIRAKVITDNNLTTTDELNIKAINLLAVDTTLEQSGSAEVYGLPLLKPGYQILIVDMYCNVSTMKDIINVTHTIDSGGFRTHVQFEEEEKGVVQLFKSSIQREQESANIKNKYAMENSHIVAFDGDNIADYSTDFSDTTVWDSNLMLSLGKSTGYIITNMHTADKNVTAFTVIVVGSNLASDEGESWVDVEVSCDNGAVWDDVLTINDTLHTPSSSGKKIKIKITITSLTTKIRAIGVLYK